ncbi:unnamed protein product [Amoebophrya sp. A25]|nr:unnamed protein product [Amoebophrya sp. A25]|eukprot:GSA25T00027394001.1
MKFNPDPEDMFMNMIPSRIVCPQSADMNEIQLRQIAKNCQTTPHGMRRSAALVVRLVLIKCGFLTLETVPKNILHRIAGQGRMS